MSIAWIGYSRFGGHSTGYMAYVYSQGQLVQTIPLDQFTDDKASPTSTDSAAPFFTVTGQNGLTNTISVSSDGICVTNADCPDKLCMKMGNIHSPSQVPIVCLPSELVIEIRRDAPTAGAQASSTDVDAVTY
ncbi:MAG: NusG domain II-containing protein [Lachnospiraceae bacterium]|nr:NusG domain II-containing protein [Lachnospiraceae bacterium]